MIFVLDDSGKFSSSLLFRSFRDEHRRSGSSRQKSPGRELNNGPRESKKFMSTTARRAKLCMEQNYDRSACLSTTENFERHFEALKQATGTDFVLDMN